jgi:LysR family glycine cleavage system transcriptional activator
VSSRDLPLKTLPSFAAVARLLSFSAAAKELHVSQSAMSQAMRSLEQAIGVPLFVRLTRRIELTEAGEILARAAQGALDDLNKAVRQIRGQTPQESFSVGALTSFGSQWLARRITKFCATCPDVDVSLYAVFEPRDMEQHHVDIAILYGDGHWKGHLSEEIFREYIFPVCHPRLLDGRQSCSLDELLNLPLLRDADPKHDYWPAWLSAAGLTNAHLRKGPRFDNLSDMITAVLDGDGVALARSALVADELKNGHLIRLSELNFRAQYSYYLVWPQKPRKPGITATFRSWLLAELQGTPGVLVSRTPVGPAARAG